MQSSEVRRHLGTLHIRVMPDGARASLDGVTLALLPSAFADVRAAVGPAELRAEAPGLPPVVRQVVIERDGIVTVDLTLSPVEAPPPPPVTAVRRTPVLAFGLFGAAGVVAVVGTVAGVEALTLAHDYNTAGQPDYQVASVKDRGVAWRTGADVLFVTAGVTAAAGVYFLFRSLGRANVDVHTAFGPTSCSLAVDF